MPLFSKTLLGRMWLHATSDGVPKRALIVAFVVGTLLNLINQGDALFAGRPVSIVKALLTYLVPYCVNTYGAVSYRWHMEKQQSSA